MDFAVLADKRAALMLPTFSFTVWTWERITSVPRSIPEWEKEGSVRRRVNQIIPSNKESLKVCVMQNKCNLFLNAKPHVGNPLSFDR